MMSFTLCLKLHRVKYWSFVVLILSPFLIPVEGLPFVPNDPYFYYNSTERPYFPGQWHLDNNAPEYIFRTFKDWPDAPDWYKTDYAGKTVKMINSGVDANLSDAWQVGYTGKGVVIGIVDDGVEGAQEDISPNYSKELSRMFLQGKTLEDKGPILKSDNHGTAVAGVAAARGGNGIGGTGAAPYATIAGLRLLDSRDSRTIDEDYFFAYMWKSGVDFNEQGDSIIFAPKAPPEIQIKNHSYGNNQLFSKEEMPVLQSLHETALNGVIHVFAAGNARGTSQEDANKDAPASHRDVINVAALGSDGKFTNYSSYGSSVFVTAPSSRTDYQSNTSGFGITTTDRTGRNLGYNSYSKNNCCGDDWANCGDLFNTFPDYSYTSTFGGTSSAAPLVSGIMALGREANPDMDVRIAKHALVRTSEKVDPDDMSSTGGWLKNGAGNWFNPNYGFGNIDAGAFVRTVKKIAYVTEQTTYSTGITAVNAPIQSLNDGGTTRDIDLTTAQLTDSIRQSLEGVEIYLNFTHPKRGDLTASLLSPSGTTSCFLNATSHLPKDEQDMANVDNFGWTFLSNAFWGEDPLGSWTITMADTVQDNVGTWSSYNLTLLMGDITMNDNLPAIQKNNIRARSLTLSSSTAGYTIPAGLIFQARDSINLNGGSLVVNGGITENTGGYGSRVKLNNGVLSGNGSLTASRGIIHNGGTISPGNSIGTLTINGNYRQESQAKLLIEVASPAGNDLLAINGSASLNGILETSWTGGYIPAPQTRFGTILTASSGITGQFSRLLVNITPTVMFKPRYGINEIYLVTERDYLNENLLPYLTANQKAVGSMLNSVGNTATGDLNEVLSKIDALPSCDRTAYALDQLAPRGGEAQFGMGIAAATFQNSNMADRLSDLRDGMRGISFSGLSLKQGDVTKGILIAGAGSDLTGMIPSGMDDRWGFFLKGNAVAGDHKDTPDYPGYDFTTAGITMGGDYRFTKSLIAGVMLGINASRGNTDNMGSKVRMDGFALGLYGTYYRQEFFMDGQISYGLSCYDNTRRIVFPGLDRTASSSPHGNQFNAYWGMGREFRIKRWMIAPAISLQYIKLGIDSYTEHSAGALNLDVDKQSAESLQGNIGGRISYTWQTDKALVIPGIRASYGHDFAHNNGNVTAQLVQGSSPFSIEVASPDRNFLSLGAGITAITKNALSLSINYGAQIGESRYIAHSINAGLRMGF